MIVIGAGGGIPEFRVEVFGLDNADGVAGFELAIESVPAANMKQQFASGGAASLTSEMSEYGLGGLRGLRDAGADGWAGEVIPGEKEAGDCGRETRQRFDDAGVAKIVLRQGARIFLHADRGGWRGDAQDLREFVCDLRGDFGFGERAESRVGCASGETGYADVAHRRAVGEERGVPYGSEQVQSFAARNEKTEAVERVADRGAHVAH